MRIVPGYEMEGVIDGALKPLLRAPLLAPGCCKTGFEVVEAGEIDFKELLATG